MKEVLITKGKMSGFKGSLIYTFYRHPTEGYEQQKPPKDKGWAQSNWVVPHFDHCGTPKIVEKLNDELHVL